MRSPVIKAVKAFLKAYSDFFPEIFVTGHSLGGALAVFAALDIKETLPKTHVRLYTYGQPRVGNEGFSDYIF